MNTSLWKGHRNIFCHLDYLESLKDVYSCNRLYDVCAFHKQTNSALLFPLRGYCKEGWRQKRSCAVLKYSAVPRRDTQMKCCSSTQVRQTSVDQQTAQTVVPWQKPVCIQVRAPSLHLLLIRACWQMLDPPHSLHPLLLRVCWQMLPLRTPCTGSLSERAGRYPARPSALRAPAPLPIVLAWRPPSCSLFWTKAKASSCSLFWRKAAGLLPSPPCPSTEFLPPEPTECPQRPLFLPPPLPTPPLCPL